MVNKKIQSKVISELQHNADIVILNNPLSAPSLIRKLGLGKELHLTEIYTPKLFYDIISRITPEHLELFEQGKDVVTLTLHIGDFLKAISKGNSNNMYRHIIDCIDALQTTQIKWKDDEKETGTAIITHYEYYEKQGKVDVVLYKEFVKKVVEVTQNQHFSFLKRYLYQLQNAQAIKLFPFLVSWRNRGMVELDLMTFKKKFGYNTEGYAKFSNLKLKVLEPAIKEINDKTDLFISYKLLGDNLDGIRPRVSGLQFFIKERKSSGLLLSENQVEVITPEAQTVSSIDSIQEYVSDRIVSDYYEKIADFWGVEKSVFIKEATGKSETDIQIAIEYTKEQVRLGKADRPAGVFIDALRKGYKTIESTKKEVSEKKLKNTATKAQIKQDEQAAITHKKQNKFDANKKTLEILIETDADFKRELLAAVGENNVIKRKYDFNKTVLDNMETAMIAGVIMNLAVGLRPSDFS
jgi:plasmid replication initiation protein